MAKDFRNISTLHEWDRNPRSITKDGFERLKKHITDHGQMQPLVITGDGEVLGGNMRIKAYRDLQIKDVWVEVVEPKDEAEKLRIALVLNERSGFYDDDLLANLVPNYPEFNWEDYSVDLKEPTNLQDLLDQFKEVVEDEVPEVSDEPAASKLGEMYQLGRHRLLCGDSTKIEDVEKLMDGKKADMILTDPPYGIAYKESKNWAKPTYVKRPIIGDDKPFDYTTIAWPKCDIWCIWGANYFCNTIPNFYDGNFIVWAKAHSDQENDVFGSSFELAWMYPSHKQMIWYVRRINMGKEEHGLHVTQKPIEIYIRAMKYHSLAENTNIVDLFGGSGSTLIACEQTNRTCKMMELDPNYVDTIRKRYANFIKKGEEWQTVTPAM